MQVAWNIQRKNTFRTYFTSNGSHWENFAFHGHQRIDKDIFYVYTHMCMYICMLCGYVPSNLCIRV
jgi:hypothetical protein